MGEPRTRSASMPKKHKLRHVVLGLFMRLPAEFKGFSRSDFKPVDGARQILQQLPSTS